MIRNGSRALAVLVLTLGGSALPATDTTVGADRTREQPAPAVSLAPAEAVTEAVAPFAVDEAMREWAEERVGQRGSREQRLQRLLEALVGERGLDITYNAGHTGTAEEVFASGTANCLGFTHLFVGLAREIGIGVDYLRVHDVQRIERQGAYVVVSGHVSAGYNTGPEYQVLDFSDLPVDDYRRVEVLPDQAVVALHHVNRGAELMLQGRWTEAGPWLDLGIELDPTLPEAWVNLGVYRRRQGRPADAEAAYRRAMELDPNFTAPYQNLAAILLSDPERRDEAFSLLDQAMENNTRNPYLFLALGDLARNHDKLEVAGDYYRRAVSLAPDEVEALAAMGIWAHQTDKPQKARRLLRRAKQLDPEHPRVQVLESRLSSS